MRINNIKIYDFKSIRLLELDFDNELRGLWKLGGNTGAGKTSVAEAIIFGLFGDVKGKKKETLIRWGQPSANVTLEVISKGHKINISRTIGKKANVSVLVDDIPMEYTNKSDIQTQLETDYYDISRIGLETLCLISFNNFKSLIRMSAAETREFIDKTIGTCILTEYTNVIKNKKKELLVEVDRLTNEMNIVIGKIDEIENTKKQVTDDNIDEKINTATEQITNLTNRANNKLDEIRKEAVDISARLADAKSRLDESIKEEAEIRTNGVHIKQKLTTLAAGKCPTCGQDVPTELIDELTKEKLDLGKAWQESNNIVTECRKLVDETQAQLNENITMVNKVNSSLQMKVSELQSDIKRYNKERELREFLNKNTQDFTVQLNDIKDKIDKLNNDINKWESLAVLINVDIRTKIVNNIIPIVNKEISNLCSRLNQPYDIILTPDFNALIKNGDIDVSAASLSTGQSKTLDMIVILAIVKTLVDKMPFNIFFLDELFSNMDAELRNCMCEVLQDLAVNHSVFVLSHADVQNRFFAGIIEASLITRSEYPYSEYEISKFH